MDHTSGTDSTSSACRQRSCMHATRCSPLPPPPPTTRSSLSPGRASFSDVECVAVLRHTDDSHDDLDGDFSGGADRAATAAVAATAVAGRPVTLTGAESVRLARFNLIVFVLVLVLVLVGVGRGGSGGRRAPRTCTLVGAAVRDITHRGGGGSGSSAVVANESPPDHRPASTATASASASAIFSSLSSSTMMMDADPATTAILVDDDDDDDDDADTDASEAIVGELWAAVACCVSRRWPLDSGCGACGGTGCGCGDCGSCMRPSKNIESLCCIAHSNAATLVWIDGPTGGRSCRNSACGDRLIGGLSLSGENGNNACLLPCRRRSENGSMPPPPPPEIDRLNSDPTGLVIGVRHSSCGPGGVSFIRSGAGGLLGGSESSDGSSRPSRDDDAAAAAELRKKLL